MGRLLLHSLSPHILGTCRCFKSTRVTIFSIRPRATPDGVARREKRISGEFLGARPAMSCHGRVGEEKMGRRDEGRGREILDAQIDFWACFFCLRLAK